MESYSSKMQKRKLTKVKGVPKNDLSDFVWFSDDSWTENGDSEDLNTVKQNNEPSQETTSKPRKFSPKKMFCRKVCFIVKKFVL